jgi:hypothetical protein
MIPKLYSVSKLLNPGVTGDADQVCSQDDHKQFLVNVIETNNGTSIDGTNLKGSMDVRFVPCIKQVSKEFQSGLLATPVMFRELFLSSTTPLNTLLFFVVVGVEDAILPSRAPLYEPP